MPSKNEIVYNKAKSLGATDIYISKRKNKKYAVEYNGKIIHFGDSRYDDYLDHGDEKRRENYRKRASKIRNKKGELTYKDKNSPNYYSFHILWS
jgi:hypothetical protein